VSTTQRYTQEWLAWEWRGKAITAVAPKTYEKVEWSEDLTRKGKGARKQVLKRLPEGVYQQALQGVVLRW
jgi:hypothetical protein